MATSIPVRFAELPRQFTARSWGLRNFNRSFVALPVDATCLVVPSKQCIFVNRAGDRLRHELTLEEAKKWGDDQEDLGEDDLDDDEMETVYAKAHSGTDRFCLRLVFHAEKVMHGEGSSKHRAFRRLLDDAKFHATHLPDAEGSMVPIHHGMWFMDTGDWAGTVVLSITQWGGTSWRELSHTRMNTEANRILIGRTFEALHDYGVHWGGLEGSKAGFRHAVIDIHSPGLSREDLLNGKAPCYIVGFSEASIGHDCMRRVPILPLGSYLRDEQIGCAEIADILILLEFMKPGQADVPASKAVAWYTQYSRRHPEQSHMDVSIVQRARLYFRWPPVYPDLRVTFEDTDEYSKGIIEETEPDADHVASFRSDSSSPEPASSQVDNVAAKLAVASLEDITLGSKV
ncbi:hypothetical protein C8R47DRAFT_715228 [Mycena vitilis]|nr:hypothetical protein C8R47DRAFT_715228 [Mycena vitilis]